MNYIETDGTSVSIVFSRPRRGVPVPRTRAGIAAALVTQNQVPAQIGEIEGDRILPIDLGVTEFVRAVQRNNQPNDVKVTGKVLLYS
jgi:hypothetical protein